MVGGWGGLLHYNGGLCIGQNIDGTVNFIKKKEGHFFFIVATGRLKAVSI